MKYLLLLLLITTHIQASESDFVEKQPFASAILSIAAATPLNTSTLPLIAGCALGAVSGCALHKESKRHGKRYPSGTFQLQNDYAAAGSICCTCTSYTATCAGHPEIACLTSLIGGYLGGRCLNLKFQASMDNDHEE